MIQRRNTMNINNITIGSRWRVRKEWSDKRPYTKDATIVITKVDKNKGEVSFDYTYGMNEGNHKKGDTVPWLCDLDEEFFDSYELVSKCEWSCIKEKINKIKENIK
jgi:hypothetical protein